MTNTNYPDNITALYARLSQEDTLDGESNSIANHEIVRWAGSGVDAEVYSCRIIEPR